MQLGISQPGLRPGFVPLKNRGIPSRLLTADAILKDACGADFDAVSAVLTIAATWTPGDAVTTVRRAELRDAVTGWSSLPRAEIDAALERLTLTPDQLRQDEMRYWEQEKRSHRLAIRPLVSASGTTNCCLSRVAWKQPRECSRPTFSTGGSRGPRQTCRRGLSTLSSTTARARTGSSNEKQAACSPGCSS